LKGTLVKASDVRGLVAKTAMRRHPTAQESGTPPSEAERLRCARLSVWENEGGGLGPLRQPPSSVPEELTGEVLEQPPREPREGTA
jgi:hypothetical protein